MVPKEEIEEAEKKREEINKKIQLNQPLTNEELWMMGDQLELDSLCQHPKCHDIYYRRLYLEYDCQNNGNKAFFGYHHEKRGSITTLFQRIFRAYQFTNNRELPGWV